MAATTSTVPFKGTKEQMEQLLAKLDALKSEKGNLIPALQAAQDIYDYLPIEVQTVIAKELDVPLEKVYGVSTFYSMFHLQPKGRHQIQVCLGTACYVKGSGDVYHKLSELLNIKGGECTPDGKFSLDACRCIGACGLAPAMMVNGEVYGRLDPDQMGELLDKFD